MSRKRGRIVLVGVTGLSWRATSSTRRSSPSRCRAATVPGDTIRSTRSAASTIRPDTFAGPSSETSRRCSARWRRASSIRRRWSRIASTRRRAARLRVDHQRRAEHRRRPHDIRMRCRRNGNGAQHRIERIVVRQLRTTARHWPRSSAPGISQRACCCRYSNSRTFDCGRSRRAADRVPRSPEQVRRRASHRRRRRHLRRSRDRYGVRAHATRQPRIARGPRARGGKACLRREAARADEGRAGSHRGAPRRE